MAGIDKSTVRVIAVIVLLFVTAWALRGYLPGIDVATERQRQASSPAALIVDIALLSISVAIIGLAIITRLRNREARRPGPGQLPGSRGAMGRPTWRLSLIAFALAIGWLLLVMLLMQLGVGEPGEQTPSETPTAEYPGTAPPTTTNPAPPQPDSPDDPGPNVISYLIPPMLILMTLIVVGTAVVSRRQRRLGTSWPPAHGDAPETSAQADARPSSRVTRRWSVN
jgi:hypothetical protein